MRILRFLSHLSETTSSVNKLDFIKQPRTGDLLSFHRKFMGSTLRQKLNIAHAISYTLSSHSLPESIIHYFSYGILKVYLRNYPQWNFTFHL